MSKNFLAKSVSNLELIKNFSKDQASVGFKNDPVTNKQILKVKKNNSEELVVQIPSEVSIRIAQKLDKIKGNFFDALI